MSIHIGKIIREAVRSSGMNITEFADKINYSRRNVYDIFEKESIDTGILFKISKVLDKNLFLNYISKEELESFNPNSQLSDKLKLLVDSLEKEVTRLKEIK